MNEQQKTALIVEQRGLYPTLNEEQLYSRLIFNDIPTYKSIPTKYLELYLIEKGVWVNFKNNSALEVARDALSLFEPEIDVKNNYQLFDMLIQGMVDEPTIAFDESNKSDIMAMAEGIESWADQNIPDLTMGDVIRAFK